ncbi:MAG: type II toxin-antitoxin system RelE/ParE family toxin [Chitinophagales bacterium]|nr:type II toxin-antitoxin system RelE/ParE family toxin [Chitinophagales bacterium]
MGEIGIIFYGDIFSVLSFFENNNKFILTNGFIKKLQKTPQSVIKLAEERKKNYYERKR